MRIVGYETDNDDATLCILAAAAGIFNHIDFTCTGHTHTHTHIYISFCVGIIFVD